MPKVLHLPMPVAVLQSGRIQMIQFDVIFGQDFLGIFTLLPQAGNHVIVSRVVGIESNLKTQANDSVRSFQLQ